MKIYHVNIPSTLALDPDDRRTGFGGMSSSAAGVAYNIYPTPLLAAIYGIPPKPFQRHTGSRTRVDVKSSW
jgi:hypothetical protein